MSRLIPRKELNISDNVDKVINKGGSLEDINPTPPKDYSDYVRNKVDKQAQKEDFYIREQKLLAAHKLKLRNASTQQIADLLKVTTDEAADLLLELRQRTAEALRKDDPMSIIAESTAFYDEMIGEALRQLDKVKAETNPRVGNVVRLLEIAIKARSEKDKFLVNTGILNNNQQNEHTHEGEEVQSAVKVRSLLTDIITGESELIDEQ